MTRRKKTRKTGPLAASKKPKAEMQRTPYEQRKHIGKGRKPGSRANPVEKKAGAGSTAAPQDPRFGSKKPIELIKPQDAASQADASQAPQPMLSAEERQAALAELHALESDTRLQQLLERLEADDELTEAEEEYVDIRTERFEQLAEKLGIELEDDDDS